MVLIVIVTMEMLLPTLVLVLKETWMCLSTKLGLFFWLLFLSLNGCCVNAV